MTTISQQGPDDAALRAWDDRGAFPQAGLARVIAHPKLAEAAQALARNMLQASQEDERLDGIFKDAGRYTAVAWGAYLHASDDLTLPRLKAASVSSGFASSGRARSLLHYLLHLGFIEPATSDLRAPGAPARYTLTPAFLESWRRHFRAALEAASVLEPAVRTVLDRLDDAPVFDSLVRIHAGALLSASPEIAQDHPYVRIFLHRHAGIQLVWALWASPGAEFPSRYAAPVSMAALARRFGVSRIHVRRMLVDAEAAGLVSRDASGALTLEDATRDFIRRHFAAQLLMLLIAAARTAIALPLDPDPRPDA